MPKAEVKVEELAEAQKETQKEVGRLDRTMEGLAEAQRRTEIEIQKLSKGLDETRGGVGGLSKSMGYAFENEAYRYVNSLGFVIFCLNCFKKLYR